MMVSFIWEYKSEIESEFRTGAKVAVVFYHIGNSFDTFKSFVRKYGRTKTYKHYMYNIVQKSTHC